MKHVSWAALVLSILAILMSWSGRSGDLDRAESLNVATGAYSRVAGGYSNTADGEGTTVGGGVENMASKWHTTVAGGKGNMAREIGATVSGGRDNDAGGILSSIGGGRYNAAPATAGTVGGGTRNLAAGTHGTVAGGEKNQTHGDASAIGGGSENSTSNRYAAVAGGIMNVAAGAGSSVGGGGGNGALASWSAVVGGWNNLASGKYAMIPGGQANVARGESSFAAGQGALALHKGSFVWADTGSDGIFRSDNEDQFKIRASGGIVMATHAEGKAGVKLNPGSGAWSMLSDVNAKENIQPVAAESVLEELAALSVSRWTYRSEEGDVWHIGPMAQDFAGAFELGADKNYINSLDADGVAFAAIQALYQRVLRLEEENRELKSLIHQ